MQENPLALICYNRPRHLAQVLEALRAIEPRPLYVFSDGPKDDDGDIALVTEVRRLLMDVDWTPPVISIKFENKGLACSVVGAVDWVLERHETVIVLEDDCVPGPYFMDWMAQCLEKYRDNERVMAVSGYAYHLPPHLFQGYGYDGHFFPRIETWGWATWRRAWAHYVRDGDLAAKYREAVERNVGLAQGGRDIPAIIRNKMERGVDSWSPGWLLGTALAGGQTIYPTLSHICYIGADGSGANMPATDRWETRMATERPTQLPDEVVVHRPAYEAMRGIFNSL